MGFLVQEPETGWVGVGFSFSPIGARWGPAPPLLFPVGQHPAAAAPKVPHGCTAPPTVHSTTPTHCSIASPPRPYGPPLHWSSIRHTRPSTPPICRSVARPRPSAPSVRRGHGFSDTEYSAGKRMSGPHHLVYGRDEAGTRCGLWVSGVLMNSGLGSPVGFQVPIGFGGRGGFSPESGLGAGLWMLHPDPLPSIL